MAFWGGLSVQSTFPYGTAADVRREGERLLSVIGKNGGYVLAPSHALTGDVPPQNIAAFIDLARNQPGLTGAARWYIQGRQRMERKEYCGDEEAKSLVCEIGKTRLETKASWRPMTEI